MHQVAETTTRTKLAKLLPRLGTDHAGEVVATVEQEVSV